MMKNKDNSTEELILQALLDWEDNFNTMVTVHDKDFNILRANKSAEKILGMSFSEIEKRKCFKNYHGKDCPPEGCPSCECLKTEKPAIFEMFEPHLNMFIEIKVIPRFDRNNQFVGLIHVVRDITDRKKAEEELKRHQNHLQDLVKEQTTELTKTNEQLQLEIAEHKLAEKRKAQLLEEVERINQELGNFVYIASHHLKSPLRAISTLANWISTDYTDKLDKAGKDQLELLVSRANRMYALINGILEYSKFERINKVKVNINKIVTEVIDMVAPPKNIKIKVENELPSILCEKTHIVEIFQNLLSNAINYMDKPEGIIKIGCVEDNGYWKFSVSDNGPGIEERYFEKIFQIFQTLSPIDEQESIGLGLALIKKIVAMYKGKVWVESEVGHGSTFFFTLPLGTKDN